MKKRWSSKWKKSRQPRKQRKYRINAPLHVRHKFLSANLSPELRKSFGKRSMPLRKGDEVIVMRGSSKDIRGAVERVDMKKCKVYVEGITIKKVDGSEVLKALEPSNLRIVKLKMDDKRRQMVVERAEKKEKPRKEHPVKKEKGSKKPKKEKPKKEKKPKKK